VKVQVCTLEPATRLLFDTYPREVGKKRQIVRYTDELQSYIEHYNGFDECFTSDYALNGVIDKIVWDLDSTNIDYAKALCRYFVSQHYPYIPVASGRKGFHIYLLLKPQRYENEKQLLYAVTMNICESVYGKYDTQLLIQNGIIDPCLIGNIRSMIRLPNTLRPPQNLSYCTYLSKDFFNMTNEDVSQWIKHPHFIDYDFTDCVFPTLNDFNVDISKYAKNNPTQQNGNSKCKTNIGELSDVHRYLVHILRPCLYKHIIKSNPSHKVRVISAIDLLQNLEKLQVIELFSRLDWVDFNEGITNYQVECCSRYHSYGCGKIRKYGIPQSVDLSCPCQLLTNS